MTADGEPSNALLLVLRAAHRRACRAGISVVGTDLVFHYAVPRVPAMWRLMPGHHDRLWRRVRRGTAGLADPDPPAQTQLTPVFDDDVAFETAAALRKAALAAADVRPRPGQSPTAIPVFSPGVRWAVYEALHEARRCGVSARPAHLVFGLLTLPGGAASQLLAQWTAIDPRRLVAHVRADPAYRTDGQPWRWAVAGLTAIRALPPEPDPVILRWPWRLGLALTLSAMFERPYRRHGARYGHPLLSWLKLSYPTTPRMRGMSTPPPRMYWSPCSTCTSS